MTDKPDNVTVEQCDADAAADLIEQYWGGAGSEHDGMRRLAQSYRDGHTPGVWPYAFARHRLANQPPRSEAAGRDELVARLRRAQIQFEAIGVSYAAGADAAHLAHMASIGVEDARQALAALTSKGEKP